jgi:hypothetical protein
MSPGASTTGVSNQEPFILRATDADGDGLQYKIEVCSTSDCSVIVRTVDQTQSQTGWTGQDANGGTAYVSGATISQSREAMYYYQNPTMTPNTQYWWRAYSIDPLGTNTWSSASPIQTFTTGVNLTKLQGGVNIVGGTRFGN